MKSNQDGSFRAYNIEATQLNIRFVFLVSSFLLPLAIYVSSRCSSHENRVDIDPTNQASLGLNADPSLWWCSLPWQTCFGLRRASAKSERGDRSHREVVWKQGWCGKPGSGSELAGVFACSWFFMFFPGFSCCLLFVGWACNLAISGVFGSAAWFSSVIPASWKHQL